MLSHDMLTNQISRMSGMSPTDISLWLNEGGRMSQSHLVAKSSAMIWTPIDQLKMIGVMSLSNSMRIANGIISPGEYGMYNIERHDGITLWIAIDLGMIKIPLQHQVSRQIIKVSVDNVLDEVAKGSRSIFKLHTDFACSICPVSVS